MFVVRGSRRKLLLLLGLRGWKAVVAFCFVVVVGSATATGGSFSAYLTNPAVYNIGGAAATVIRVDVDGIGRTVFCTATTFHAPVLVDDSGLAILNNKHTVWTDQFTGAATYTFFN